MCAPVRAWYRIKQCSFFLLTHTHSSTATHTQTHTLATSIWVCFWPVLGGAWQKKLSLTTVASVSAAGESRLPTHTWPALLSFTELPAASLRMGCCLRHCPLPLPSSSLYPGLSVLPSTLCPHPCFPSSHNQESSDMVASNIHKSHAAT